MTNGDARLRIDNDGRIWKRFTPIIDVRKLKKLKSHKTVFTPSYPKNNYSKINEISIYAKTRLYKNCVFYHPSKQL